MKRRRLHQGFTLIELMVSLAIFSIIIVVVGGAYLNVVSVDRQTRALNSLINNLTFVTDSMSRNMRSGSDYCNFDGTGSGTCNAGTGGPSDYSSFFYIDQNGCQISYYLSGGQILEDKSGGGSCSNVTGIPLTDPGITITNMDFNVHAGRGGSVQANAIYTISGRIVVDATHTQTFTIESMATQRLINI